MRLLRDPVLTSYIILAFVALYSLANWVVPGAGRPDCRIEYVYDGDTVSLICAGQHQTARLIGLDTPETKEAGCAQEKALGDRATARLRALVAAGKEFRFVEQGHDRYGRALLQLWIDGQDVAEVLIGEGLATEYDGGARVNWCDRLGTG